jgi:hypothetical protein
MGPAKWRRMLNNPRKLHTNAAPALRVPCGWPCIVMSMRSGGTMRLVTLGCMEALA